MASFLFVNGNLNGNGRVLKAKDSANNQTMAESLEQDLDGGIIQSGNGWGRLTKIQALPEDVISTTKVQSAQQNPDYSNA